MIATTRARALSIALGAVLCLTLAVTAATTAAAAGSTSIHYQSETVKAYEQQLSTGKIASVAVNKRLRSLRITLKNGQYVKTRYAAHQEPKMVAAIKAQNVPVTILTSAEAEGEAKAVPKHHKLRYIVGGAVLAVIAIVGGVLLIRRRRDSEDE